MKSWKQSRGSAASESVTLSRTFDATFLNRVVNHPEVRPWVGRPDAGEGDLTALVIDPANVTLVNQRGGFVYVRKAPGVFEVHTQFLPGGSATQAARESVAYMFDVIGAEKLITAVPEDNLPAFGLALKAGFFIAGSRMDDGSLSGRVQRIREMDMNAADFHKAQGRWNRDKMQRKEQACQS